MCWRLKTLFFENENHYPTALSVWRPSMEKWNIKWTYKIDLMGFWPCISILSRLELITNLTHRFLYFIIILHRDPQHVSSIVVLIFRRKICIFTIYGIFTLCMLPHSEPIKSGLLIGAQDGSIKSVTIPDIVNIQIVVRRCGQRCSKHVEDHDVMLL
jgi:hypothetical protein